MVTWTYTINCKTIVLENAKMRKKPKNGIAPAGLGLVKFI